MTLPPFPDQNRPERAVIAITGETALAFLDNLLTCDCATLVDGEARYGALLTPQGKILHDIFVFNTGKRILIDCAATQRNALLLKLTMYRLRAKLQIELDNELEVGVHMERPGDVQAYADPRHAELGFRSFAPAGSFINAPAHQGYDLRRVTLGIADTAEIGSDVHFPHEANFDRLGAVSFTKGCYVGQEVVSRMEHRGLARNRMVAVRIGGSAAVGDAVTADDVKAGVLLAIVTDRGLALLRLDRVAEAKSPLRAGTAFVEMKSEND